jgi:anti-anti-sigma regulatory factor
MKLRLTYRNDIAILEVSGEITQAQVPILGAGIRKHLRLGKNRIALLLKDVTSLPQEGLAEIARLHQAAAELQGAIVLVGLSASLSERLAALDPPTSIERAETLEDAIVRLSHRREPAPAAPNEIEKLKHERERLEEALSSVERELLVLQRERKEPRDAGGLAARVRELESELESALAPNSAAAKAEPAPAKS